MIRVENLKKIYRSHWTYKAKKGGLEDVSFSIKKGESFALLGANGAGKTTTIKCILGLHAYSSGKVYFNDSEKVLKDKIGFLPEQPYFYQHLTVHETLNFYSKLFGFDNNKSREVIFKVLSKLKLEEFSNRKVRSLSKGQQQRVGIAQAIINDPDFLILDEPFSGLDPLSRVEIKNLFRELKSQGKTLLISSHVLSEIEELCDRAIILRNGRVVKEVVINDLHQSSEEDTFYRIVYFDDSLGNLLDSFKDFIISHKPITDKVVEIEIRGLSNSSRFLNEIVSKKVKVLEYSKKQRSLEEIFVEANS